MPIGGAMEFSGYSFEPPKEFSKKGFNEDIKKYLDNAKKGYFYTKFPSWSNYSDREKYLSELQGLLNNDAVLEKTVLEKVKLGLDQFNSFRDPGIYSLLSDYRSRLKYWSQCSTEMTERSDLTRTPS